MEHKEQYKEQYVGKHEDVYKDVEELKGKYYNIDKRTEVTYTKIDALRIEMNEKFNSLEKRFMMMWVLQTVTFLAILGLYLKGIIF
ncbi:MAG: hypothetical protein GW910_06985 [Candidatus Altiarchaeum hamiconexum]|uniref:DUF1640 domain-containing protein n=1 Tax=Candidatus Altarchaeum hamiconexum TaxID=1803513 RepID=A0A8J7YTD4_9ARCH|nr:hypothetical protein [Candidatus Altarchaeum hamiconexum]